MARGGQTKDHTGSERKCLATGEVCSKSELIRFVAGPDQQVVPDVLNRLPGRGFYVKADRTALSKAVDKKLFARGAKQPVQIPDDLIINLEQALARRVIDLISLARKAGDAVAGYEKVKDWLGKEHARVLIQATDGSERGKTKLRPPEGANGFIGVLTASELGLAFGRESVIHGALKAGGLTKRVVEEARRLSGLRMKDGGNGHLKG